MLDEQTIVSDLSELPLQLRLGLVFVDERPTVFALHRRGEGGAGGRVVAWLMVLPGDQAVLSVVDESPSRPIATTLRSVQRRWLRLLDAELVHVAGPQARHMA